jgi:hypothetical protein
LPELRTRQPQPTALCQRCSAKDDRRGPEVAAAATIMAKKKNDREKAKAEGAARYRRRR